MKDETHHEPTVQARQHRGGISAFAPRSPAHHQYKMSPLEIGMYVLLTAFCFAIVVFVASCVVYASKFKPSAAELDRKNGNNGDSSIIGPNSLKIMREPRRVRESTTNAHDWVWLGRSTMDRSSMVANENINGNVLDNNHTGWFSFRFVLFEPILSSRFL